MILHIHNQIKNNRQTISKAIAEPEFTAARYKYNKRCGQLPDKYGAGHINIDSTNTACTNEEQNCSSP